MQFRNSPAFYFSDYGDGGFVSIDSYNPNTIIHQYTNNILYISKVAGKKDNWIEIPVLDKNGKAPPSLFYAPFTSDKANSKNIAFGSDRIFLDTNQGLNGWKISSGNENSVTLPSMKPTELVSAINFVNRI